MLVPTYLLGFPSWLQLATLLPTIAGEILKLPKRITSEEVLRIGAFLKLQTQSKQVRYPLWIRFHNFFFAEYSYFQVEALAYKEV